MVENTLKEILEELKGIKKELHTIASNMESNLSKEEKEAILNLVNTVNKLKKIDVTNQF